MPKIKEYYFNETCKIRCQKCGRYLASIGFSMINNSTLMSYFYNSSVEKNISCRRLYLLLADGMNMAIIKIVPLVTPMLHQNKDC